MRISYRRQYLKILEGLCVALSTATYTADLHGMESHPDPCLESEVVNDPDLTRLKDQIGEVDQLANFKLKQIRYDFRAINVEGRRPLIRIYEIITLDLTAYRQKLLQDIVSSIKAQENCNTQLNPSSPSLEPNAAGNLSGSVSIPITFRACVIFDHPCFEGIKWESCRETWVTDLLSHTFGINCRLAGYSQQTANGLRYTPRQISIAAALTYINLCRTLS